MSKSNRIITCSCCGKRGRAYGPDGWRDACHRRWDAAGRPDGGPPPPRTPGPHILLAQYVQLRDRRRLTAAEYAARLGVSERTIQRYEAKLRAADKPAPPICVEGSEEWEAALLVAGWSRDAADCRRLLEALGLIPAAQPSPQSAELMKAGISVHGRYRAYMAGCRCDDCRAANAAAKQRSRQRAAADSSRADRAGHGKADTYKNHSCRCDQCREAWRVWQSEHRKQQRRAA